MGLGLWEASCLVETLTTSGHQPLQRRVHETIIHFMSCEPQKTPQYLWMILKVCNVPSQKGDIKIPINHKKKWCIKCFQEVRSVKLSLRQPVALGILVMIFTYTLHVGPKSVLFHSPEFPLMQGQQPRPTEGADMEQMSLLWAEALCITEHTVILSLLCDNPRRHGESMLEMFSPEQTLGWSNRGRVCCGCNCFLFSPFSKQAFLYLSELHLHPHFLFWKLTGTLQATMTALFKWSQPWSQLQMLFTDCVFPLEVETRGGKKEKKQISENLAAFQSNPTREQLLEEAI